MKSLHADYCSGDKAVAKFLTIYLEEAHAEDEWRLPESEVEVKDGVSVKVHRSIQERLDAAKQLVKNRQLNALELVCDSMQGDVTSNYDAWPERLYIILDGVVVYKGGNGPFGYCLWEVQEWLAARYGMRGESLRK